MVHFYNSKIVDKSRSINIQADPADVYNLTCVTLYFLFLFLFFLMLLCPVLVYNFKIKINYFFCYHKQIFYSIWLIESKTKLKLININ